jgi:hypothetical protein
MNRTLRAVATVSFLGLATACSPATINTAPGAGANPAAGAPSPPSSPSSITTDRTTNPSTATSDPAANPSTAPGAVAGNGGPPVDGCPVTAGTLLSTLRAWPSYTDLEPASQLTNVRCYQGYAMARTDGVHAGPARIVFQYHASSKAWSVLTAGTADLCMQVPADVKRHLGGC